MKTCPTNLAPKRSGTANSTTRFHWGWTVFFLIIGTLVPCRAAPIVSRVRATVSGAQAATSVAIYYDLHDVGEGTVLVSLLASDDGGTTWNVPVHTVSGFGIGNNVLLGNDRYILWKAGEDWPEHNAELRFRVIASTTSPAPAGFALIPAGSFVMGDSVGGGDSNERPLHTVTVSAFYLQTTETSLAQWDAVRTWALNNGYNDLNSGAGKATDHPVQTVSWYDVVKWCNAASEKAGLTPCYTVNGTIYRTGEAAPMIDYRANGYRLPTEAEWEKGARGGLSGTRFSWGDTITHSQANYYSSSSIYAYDVSPTRNYHPTHAIGPEPYTSPVGSFGANGYGLYDMAGNVWEWCGDWISGYTSSAQIDPTGAPSGSYRLTRGGSWKDGVGASVCRSSSRAVGSPATRYYAFGFRPARSLSP
ncbi:MAG: SUMF1/EgtB/PvdO family nonheme iron enzyme [Burkholderiales bacterium]|nr:SUMF1/EgtB/PvdO family nonheme iron enzyme [Opitutaceae bacterium]